MAGKVLNSSFLLLSKFGASRQESASKTATSHIREPLCATLKTTRPIENEQEYERQNANALAKSKELQPTAQSQRFAAHLLLPQPHQSNKAINLIPNKK